MAFVGIQVPRDTADRLSKVEVPGNKSEPSKMHVTLLYLGKGTSWDQILKAGKVMRDVADGTKPFSIQVANVSSFPGDEDDGVPIIGRVRSKGLKALRSQLKEGFDEKGVEYSDKYPDYKPHVTLSYHDEQPKPQSIEPCCSWKTDNMVLWGGDSGKTRAVLTIPFGDLQVESNLSRLCSELRNLTG